MKKTRFLLVIAMLCCVLCTVGFVACNNDESADVGEEYVVEADKIDYSIVEGNAYIAGVDIGGNTNIVFPEKIGNYTVVKIGDGKNVFYCTDEKGNKQSASDNVKKITIPSGAVTIEKNAFVQCNSLRVVEYADGNKLRTIGDNAFYGCKSLESISIPLSVVSIGGGAFDGCSALEAVNIYSLEAWCGISFKNLTSNPLCYARRLYLNGDELKDATIPNAISRIAPYTFAHCESIENLTLGTTLASIGNDAFYWCKSIKSITIPDSVTSIGANAFAGCQTLESVKLGMGSKLTSIGDGAFFYCTALGKMSASDGEEKMAAFPSTVKNIGMYAFAYSALKGLTFDEDSLLEDIGYRAFYECRELEVASIPTGAQIADTAFEACPKLG